MCEYWLEAHLVFVYTLSAARNISYVPLGDKCSLLEGAFFVVMRAQGEKMSKPGKISAQSRGKMFCGKIYSG